VGTNQYVVFLVVAKYRKAVYFLQHVNASVVQMCALVQALASLNEQRTHVSTAFRHLGMFYTNSEEHRPFEKLAVAQAL
jgi:peptide methionine sulfoxide reductase MsrA